MKKLSRIELNTLESLLKRAVLNEQDFKSDVDITLGKKPLSTETISPPVANKYNRVIKDIDGNFVVVDVYAVLDAFQVTCPALQHLAKKALCAGLRGHKDTSQDLEDIQASATRAIQLSNNRLPKAE